MRTAFENNPHRVAELSKEIRGLFVDMSKQRWDKEVFDALRIWHRKPTWRGPLPICSGASS